MSGGSSQNQIANRQITVTFDPAPSFDLYFNAMDGHDELGRPFLYTLDLVSTTARRLDLRGIVGSKITVKVQRDDPTTFRYFHGIVASIGFAGTSAGYFHYTVEMRPWIWLLSRQQDYKIFQGKSALDVIKQVFSDGGFSDVKDSTQHSSDYKVLDFCVQYRETSLDFVTRLMEKYGIYYYFEHTDTTHTLVLCDDPSSHATLDPSTVEFFDQTEDYFRSNDFIWEWQATLSLQSGTYTMTDYNFTNPSASLLSKTAIDGKYNNYGTLEIFEFPTGSAPITSDGMAAADIQALADVRAQELDAQREVVTATGNVREMSVGYLFTLDGFEDDPNNTGPAQDREYLVTSATYALRMLENFDTAGEQATKMFQCTITAIPNTGSVFFRLPRLTPRPTVSGPQTAKVVGASGDEITTDQYGRVKVKFFWDRVGQEDDKASCWIRVAQSWAGAQWGGMVMPRVGQEVIVEFIDGNPDQPIITGQVYNSDQKVPYGLPDNKTRSTFKTISSTGADDTKFNELRFEDKVNEEEVFLQAQKDINVQIVDGNRTVTLQGKKDGGGSDTLTVFKDRTVEIQNGDDKLTIDKGKRTVTISQGDREVTISQGADKLTVTQGDLTIDATAGNIKVTAGTKISLGVGANTLEITTSGITLTVGPNTVKLSESAVEVNGAEVKVTASADMALKGAMIAIN